MSAFHTRAVPSALAVATRRPFGLQSTSSTGLAWPAIGVTSAPVRTRQTRALPSLLAVASNVARGLNATSTTLP